MEGIKKRPEDMQERLERLIHKFEDGPNLNTMMMILWTRRRNI